MSQSGSDKEHPVFKQMSDWDRYLYYIEGAKIRSEVPLSFEDFCAKLNHECDLAFGIAEPEVFEQDPSTENGI